MFDFTIKPSSVLKNAAATISLIATKAAFCHSGRGIYIQAIGTYGGVVAIIRIDAATASHLWWSGGGRAGFDTGELYRALGRVNNDEWEVKVTSNYLDDHTVWFLFANPSIIDGIDIDEMEAIFPCPRWITGPINADHCDEYRSVVGIPSPEFIRILTYFSFHGTRVYMIVTSRRVTFSSLDGSERIVLETQNQDCIIGGVGRVFMVPIRLSFLPLFLNAASQTPTVWILAQSSRHPYQAFQPRDVWIFNQVDA